MGRSDGIRIDPHLLIRSAEEADALGQRVAEQGRGADWSTELAGVHLDREGFALGSAMSEVADSWQDTLSDLDQSWHAIGELLRVSAEDGQRTDEEIQALLVRLLSASE